MEQIIDTKINVNDTKATDDTKSKIKTVATTDDAKGEIIKHKISLKRLS